MIDGDGTGGERVVLARKEPYSMVGFQWTGQEPAGLNESEFAEAIGAVWEGDQLVTYNLIAFTHAFEHYNEEYLADPD
jgi:hypothetical protein